MSSDDAFPRPPGYRDLKVPRWRWALIAQEPIIHFFVIGGLLWILVQGLKQAPERDQDIHVTPPIVERISALYRLQTGSRPDDARREWLVQNYIREEMLFREAKALRLDDGDELVRRRLVQKVEFLHADRAMPAEPDEATLRAYHEAHSDSFVTQGTVDFHHLFFSPDKHTSAGAHAAALRAREALETGAEPIGLGDRFPLRSSYAGMTQDGVTRIFGVTPIASAPFDAISGSWTGPVESGFGWHLIRVTARSKRRPLTFEEAVDAIRVAWRAEQLSKLEASRFEDLTRRYRVVRTDQTQDPKAAGRTSNEP